MEKRKELPWYKNSYRRNLVDMHIDCWDNSFLSEFNPQKYYECLKKANIKSAMIYINSHVGYCYWPTQSGCMHPGFNGVDKIKELFDLCHSGGLDVIAYYSLIFNNWAYDNHPDWRMMDVDGNSSKERKVSYDLGKDGISGNRYGLCCPNSMGYRVFLSTQINEFCKNYNF